MASTLRQKFVDACVARMQTILVDDGYETDAGTNVAAWQTHWDQAELPAIGVFDLTNESEKGHFGAKRQTNQLIMQFRIYVASDTLATDVRVIMGDVFKAIRTDPRWTVSGIGMAVETHPKQDGFIIPQDSFEVAGAAIEIVIEYLSNTFDAYE